MPKTRLTAVTRTQGNNRALKEGAVAMPDFEVDFEEVAPLPRAFRKMVREGAYDISEMALTTYVCARAHGARLTGIPVFLVRDFHHKSMAWNRAAKRPNPKDLEGCRVGVQRGYTVTTGVWARSILADEHDVDLSRVTWARSDEEHVPDYRRPGNVEELGGEGSLEEQLARGDIPAAVGLPATGDALVPIVENAFEAGLSALKSRGLYPINHLVVIRDDVLAANPGLAVQVFDAFSKSKKLYVDGLKAGQVTEPTPVDKVHQAAMTVMDDPLPYGIEPNKRVLDMLMAAAVSQRIIDNPIPLEDLFARDLLNRIG
ncbi:4,5-dihydroxyphthalate decarboxylase [Roseibium marinum]|uniref:4,5-dihydroxyphthalate decarboxylase n=1 Tax=Roseibium marinum TaxID=281252 RepID=A0A2S3V3E9_9HYPH|nr:4,5-dihydroxyphthalate decarboxylase [Roseibium marinum]POF34514.1 4,5-dihydroxyphthalate decarboxylase [Roseibium marinum]